MNTFASICVIDNFNKIKSNKILGMQINSKSLSLINYNFNLNSNIFSFSEFWSILKI